MNNFPSTAIDRRIDTLGSETNIRSEQDAEAYLDALLAKFRVNETLLPGLAELKSRLARAEFDAVQHPDKRIPEAIVTRVFNQWMDEWREPEWARISPKEMHAFRVTMSLALYPNDVSRSPDGNLSPNCRPIEALYLLYLLHSSNGISLQLREAVNAGRWPRVDPMTLPPSAPYSIHPSSKSPLEIQRFLEYQKATAAYLASRPNLNPEVEVARLFAQLGIE